MSLENTEETGKTSATLPRRHERCAYIKCCYLADSLGCYGFKYDCALYLRSNGEATSSADFDSAMNELIDKARAKAQNLVD